MTIALRATALQNETQQSF